MTTKTWRISSGGAGGGGRTLWLATTKAPQDYCQARFREGCWLFFGKETAGLPEAFRLAHYDRCIRLPMVSPARSLNLSNSVAVLTYEALRQQGFPRPAALRRNGRLIPRIIFIKERPI